MIEKKVFAKMQFAKMQKVLKCCKKYCRNATFVADSNGCGVRCSYGELLYRRRVADKQGCANAFCVTTQLPPVKFEEDVDVHVRLEILNPDGKPLSRKLLIYSDTVQGTVKAAIPFYRT